MADPRLAAARMHDTASRVAGLPRELRTELRRTLKAAGDEAAAAVKAAAMGISTEGFAKPGARRHVSPARRPQVLHGLRERVAGTVTVQTRMASRQVTVSLVSDGRKMGGSAGKLPSYLNYKTRWRHPVFGDRKVWAAQQARRGGWFTQTAKDEKSKFRDAALSAIHAALDKAGR